MRSARDIADIAAAERLRRDRAGSIAWHRLGITGLGTL